MRKIILLLVALFLATPSAFAIEPFQPLTASIVNGANDQVLATSTSLVTVDVTWNAETTARYLMIFDATVLPSNGTPTLCSTSHVTGCLLWCSFMPASGTAPQQDWRDWGVHPLAAKFGLVIAASTGAGCGTLTIDTGAGNTFTSQAY